MDVAEKIKELRSQGVTVYSFSRLGVDCDYEYYNTYVKRNRGIDNVYTLTGTFFHDSIEKIVKGEMKKEDLKLAYFEKMTELEMLNVKFPNDSIKNSWQKDMEHAVDNLQLIDGKALTEKQVLFELLPGIHITGWVDCIKPTDTKPYVDIIDWKTSSKFTGKKLVSAGRQLLLYKLALEATTPFKINKLMWNMLKYMIVKWNQPLKSGKLSPKSKMVSRGKWVRELRNNLEKDLKEHDELAEFEIEMLLDEAVQNNNINNLPQDIQDKYTFEDAYVEYEPTEERIEELKQYVKSRVDEINSKNKYDENDWKPVELKSDHDTFYCANLCGHRKHCKHYKAYLNKADFKDKEKKDETLDDEFYNLFGDVQ